MNEAILTEKWSSLSQIIQNTFL